MQLGVTGHRVEGGAAVHRFCTDGGAGAELCNRCECALCGAVMCGMGAVSARVLSRLPWFSMLSSHRVLVAFAGPPKKKPYFI